MLDARVGASLSCNVRHSMRLLIPVFTLTLLAAMGAEMIPDENVCAAVFSGQVIADEIIDLRTNQVGSVKYGIIHVTELHRAHIKVESITKQDRPFQNEVTVYYVRDASQVCPRPVRLATWNRGKFHCLSQNIGARTNLLVLPMASFVTSP